MRVTVESGSRRVDIRTDPGDGISLRAAEAAARRLLAALPEPAPAPDEGEGQGFGFSLSAEIERADPPALRGHDPEEYEPDTRSAP